jgi:hypothetical protein
MTTMELNFEMEVQTRSDTCQNNRWPGLNYFNSLKEALEAYDQDNTIWKISYTDANDVDFRWRPKYKKEIWKWSEDHINKQSEIYRNARPNDLFWINQLIIIPNCREVYRDLAAKSIPENDWDQYIMPMLIQDIKTDAEFRAMAATM